MVWYQHPIFVCVVACIIPNLGGLLGALVTETSADSWYGKLEKPSFNPPNWLFAPAWTILYLTQGFASFLVWWRGGDFNKTKIPLFFYAVSLLLNWIWTPIFFGFQSLGGALVEIVFMWIFVVITTAMFFKTYLPAGIIMLPYVGWITFATILNAALWSLNKS